MPSSKSFLKQDVVAYVSNSSTQEEAVKTPQVQGQSGLHHETLSKAKQLNFFFFRKNSFLS